MKILAKAKSLIILEGIASTGKTTLERLLSKRIDYALISENDTLMPLIDNSDPEIALEHISQILNQAEQSSKQTVVIERLHFTHAFRTKSELPVFQAVENHIKKHFVPLVVLLTIPNENIRQRIEEVQKRRGSAWAKGKQGTLTEKIEYYSKQQKRLKDFANQTTLPVLQIDTGSKTWEEYAEKVVMFIRAQQ